MTARSDDEPIKGILEEAANVRKAFGAFGGWLLMAWAVFSASKPRFSIRLTVAAALGLAGARLGGWI